MSYVLFLNQYLYYSLLCIKNKEIMVIIDIQLSVVDSKSFG